MAARRSAIALVVACATGVIVARARAQPSAPSATAPSSAAPSASSAALVAPEQQSGGSVPYPAGASGEATVVLKILVDTNGAVESVEVIDGAEPFAAAAREAARAWTFSPATKGGAPVRAAIRAKVHFKPPPPPPPPAPTESNAEPPPVDKPIEPIELEVIGERREVAVTQIGGGEVKIMPGAFGDPFRVIEVLPGVTPIFSGLPFFYVRGAPPGNTGYFVDGVRVPLLFHLGAGPSVIAPGLIDRVDFFPSAFPARYGRFTGGIVAGETAAPPKKLRGEWNARIFDASLLVESPVGEKGDLLVAGRYGWPGLVLSLVQSEVSLQYWDYQLRAGYKVSDRDRLSVFFFGAFDRLVDKKKDKVLFDVQFHRADLRWDRAVNGGNLRIATTLMFDQTGVGDDTRAKDDRFAVRMLGASWRAELEKKLDSQVTFRGGVDLSLEQFKLVASGRGGVGGTDAQFFPSRADVTTGIRADLIVRPVEGVEVVPGARLDVFIQRNTAVPALGPRLATRIRLARYVTSVTTLGVTHQTPSFLLPVPGLRLATLESGLQTAFQYAQGLEFQLPKKVTLSATVFHTSFHNLSDALAVCASSSGCDVDTRVEGSANGLELLLKRALTERFGGILAYTLSRSQRTFKGERTPSDFDRTHVLSAAASYDLGSGIRAGLRFAYQTGRPVRLTINSFGDAPSGGLPPELARLVIQERLPAFYRFDARIEKRWTNIALVLEWFNFLLKKEAVDYSCSRSGCGPNEIGPVTIPSIGLEGSF